MTIVLNDRVKESSTTTGSGAVALAGPFGAFQPFSSLGDGTQTYYAIENESRWEIGIGVYDSGSNTLSRDTILSSSQAGNKVNLAGASVVFCTLPANRVVYADASGFMDISSFSGVVYPTQVNMTDLTVSGNLTHRPFNNQVLTILRASSGNFLNAYIDDSYDRTISLHHNGGTSPTWRLGVKDSPTYYNEAPEYGYVYGADGSAGLVADSTNKIEMANSSAFRVTHQNSLILVGSSVTGVHVNEDLHVTGSGQIQGALHPLAGVTFSNGTQTTAFLGWNPVSGWAAYASGQIAGLSSSVSTNASNISTNISNIAIDSGRITTNAASISTNAGNISTNSSNISTNASDITTNAGAILANAASITANSGYSASTYLTEHPTISAASSSSNSGRTYIQSITLDSNGHITAMTSGTETVVDTQLVPVGDSGIYVVGSNIRWTEAHTVNAAAQSGVASSGYLQGRINAVSGYAEAISTGGGGGGGSAYGNSGELQINDGAGNFIGGQIYSYNGDLAIGHDTPAVELDIRSSTYPVAQVVALAANPASFNIGNTVRTYKLVNNASGNFEIQHVAGFSNPAAFLTYYADSGVDIVKALTVGSGVTLEDIVPGATTNKLYNNAGTLYFNGSPVNTDTDTDTTYSPGSGLSLVGTTFHWTESGTPLANSGYFETKIASITDNDTTYSAGSGMALVGTAFHWTQSGIPIANSGYAESVYLKAHPSVSAASSSDNSGRTYIQDVIVDSFGHVTGLTTATETVTDTDTTYSAGSGLSLVGTTFHWTESGIPIANSGYFQTVIDGLGGGATPYGVSGELQLSDGAGGLMGGDGWTIDSNTIDSNQFSTSIKAGSTAYLHVENYRSVSMSVAGDSAFGACNGTDGPQSIAVHQNYPFGWGDNDASNGASRLQMHLVSDDHLGLYRDTNANALSVYRTYTSDSEYSRISVSGETAGPFRIKSEAAGGDTNVPILIDGDNRSTYVTNNLRIASTNVPMFGFCGSTPTGTGDVSAIGGFGFNFIDDHMTIVTPVNADRTLCITSVMNHHNDDFFHGEQDNATLFMQSATDPATDSSQWLGLVHDSASGLLMVGSGDFVIKTASGVDGSQGTALTEETFEALRVKQDGDTAVKNTLHVEKAIKTKIKTEADGATITFDMNDSNTHMATLGGNRTIAVSNAASGQKFMVRLKQDGTGSRTVTWFSDIKWENGAAPTLSSVANHADWFGFVCTSGGYYDGCVIMSGVR